MMSKPIGDGLIKFQFIVGGGCNLTFDYRIIGGPDDGRRITELPVRDMTNHGKFFNGSREEFDRFYGTDIRPCWRPYHSFTKYSKETEEAACEVFGPKWIEE
jgi:hypothetical protein